MSRLDCVTHHFACACREAKIEEETRYLKALVKNLETQLDQCLKERNKNAE